MKGAGGECILYRPVYGSFENIWIVFIQSKYKTSVDHDSQGMQALNGLFIILSEVLSFVTLQEVGLDSRFQNR